jgi:hypothetical protein
MRFDSLVVKTAGNTKAPDFVAIMRKTAKGWELQFARQGRIVLGLSRAGQSQGFLVHPLAMSKNFGFRQDHFRTAPPKAMPANLHQMMMLLILLTSTELGISYLRLPLVLRNAPKSV